MKKSAVDKYFDILLKLLTMKAYKNALNITQFELATMTGYSQQSISRILKELEEENLISRTGKGILLTNLGIEKLKEIKKILEHSLNFNDNKELVVKGKVFSGFGEGKIFLSMDFYKNAIKKITKFEPYAGTLNIRVLDEFLPNAKLIREMSGFYAKGMKSTNKEFGGFNLIPCKIELNNKSKDIIKKCYIIIPEKTHYNFSVIEIISDVHLRSTYGIHDDQILSIII